LPDIAVTVKPDSVYELMAQLGLVGGIGGPEQGNPLRPSKPMVGSPVDADVVGDEGETVVPPPEHATQMALKLRTKAAGRCLIANPLSGKTRPA
jgi:hypothetical protein